MTMLNIFKSFLLVIQNNQKILIRLIPFLILSLIPFASSNNFIEPAIGPKWVFIYASAYICLIILCSKESFFIPRLNEFQNLILLLLILTIFLNFFRENFFLYSYSTLNRISFWIIFLYSINVFLYFSHKDKLLNFISYILYIPIFLIITICFYFILIYFLDISYLNIPMIAEGTFGNKNMLAEFLGFSLVIFLSVLEDKNNILYHKKILKITSSILFLYLYYLACRSIILAISCSIIFLLFSKKIKIKTFLEIILYALFMWFLLQLPKITFINNLPTASSWSQNKHYLSSYNNNIVTANIRISYLKSTLAMIKENLWGVGSDGFDYAFIPYKSLYLKIDPKEIEKSPHNEYLRFMAEDGIIIFILGIILLSSFLCQLLKNKKCKNKIFFMCFLIFLAIQAFFQFPLEDPCPFILIAIILAYFFSSFDKNFINFKVNSYILMIISILYLTFAASLTISSYYLKTFSQNPKKMKLAYQLDPNNWLPNVFYIESLYENKKYEESLFQSMKELKQRPYNFVALYFKGHSEYALGLKSQACLSFSIYNKIFKENNKHYLNFKKMCHEKLINY
ncbi:MAG: O-antigen ligase family protein [Janthinobacterium lividum]